MTYLEGFVARIFKASEPQCERKQEGGWRVCLPVPVVCFVEFSERDVVSSRLEPRAFLREVLSRGEAARVAAMRQYEDGAEVPRLRERIRVLENERSG